MNIDSSIVLAAYEWATASPFSLALASFSARWLIYAFAIFAAFLLVSRAPRHHHVVFEGGWALLLTMVLTTFIAFFIQRARPFLDPELAKSIIPLVPKPLNTSFPSGHTGAVFAMAAAVWYADRRAGAAAYFVAFLVALGRMASGVHYPTDLLGGMAVGAFSFLAVRFFHRQLRKKDI